MGTASAARRLCVRVAELNAPPPVLPGVRVVLLPAGGPAASATADLPTCAPYSERCGPRDSRTRGDGELCFGGVEPGDYFVRTQLLDWRDTLIGPIRVPVRSFDRLDLDIALDLTWGARRTVVIGHGYHAVDGSRARPFVPPGAPPGATREGEGRNLCVAVWKSHEDFEALPTALVTLEPVESTDSSSARASLEESPRPRVVRVTDDSGMACFEGVAGGRYVATAALDGFWDATVGPFELPPRFEWLDLRIGLDLAWPGDLLVVVGSEP